MAIPWNATLTTGADVIFDPALYVDTRPGLTLYFEVSGVFWYSNQPFVTFPVVDPAGTVGRPSRLSASTYEWGLSEYEGKMYFRADSGTPTLEGAITTS